MKITIIGPGAIGTLLASTLTKGGADVTLIVKDSHKDLLKRNKKGSHYGVAETQFKLLGVMWKALADYEEKQ